MIKFSLQNGKAVVRVNGRIDVSTVGVFREEMHTLDYDAMESLELDFTDVPYVSSAGLRELLTLKKRLGSKPFLASNVSKVVNETLKMTGFDKFFEVSPANADVDYSHMSFKDLLAYKQIYGPKKAVLRARGADYTWEDIEKLSQIIAKDLHDLGVRRGTHVAVCSSNSPNWILTFYAIQKLGAIAVLVNPVLGPAEIVTLSQVGDITHFCYGEMIGMQDEASFLREITGEGSCITCTYDIQSSVDFRSRIPEYDNLAGLFESKVEADDPGVMIFTSGSTGVPKGVLLSAYNILNASCHNVRNLRITQEDKTCLMLPMFHIFGLASGFFAAAVSDATLILPDSVRAANLIQVIDQEQCTIFHTVPTMMLSIVNNKEFSEEKVKSLRSSILGGAPISEAQMIMLQEKFPNNHFGVAYGMSEMSPVTVTMYEDTKEHIVKTVGKPASGIEIQIVDPEKKTVCPAGVTGEIQIQGYGLMICYYKAEMERQAIDEDGWLHTGDLGFLDEDGYLHFVGRLKELIIRGGENIVPNEIAAAISEEEEIADVKVFGAPDEFWGEVVVAALLMKEGKTLDEAALRESLSKKLAKYKIPESFVVYAEFPHLANGKVDAINLKKDVLARLGKE